MVLLLQYMIRNEINEVIVEVATVTSNSWPCFCAYAVSCFAECTRIAIILRVVQATMPVLWFVAPCHASMSS